MTTVSSLSPVRGTANELLGLLRQWQAAEHPAPLVVETSGSTGRAKRVVLSRSAMRASAYATHERLGGPGQWVLNLPPTYVAGVQVLFRSVLAGTEPVLSQGSVAAAAAELAGPRAYLSLVPTQLHRLLLDPEEGSALRRFEAVLVGGGPLPPRVRRQAEEAGVRVVQSYGMSETCGGCVYDGYPLDGVAVKVDGEGQVLVAGPVLFDGYEGEPERTAAAMADGWLRTEDLGRIDDDGRLRIVGRTDDVVVSGGVKVPATAVAAMLARHPKVQAAHVVGVADDEWGEQVVAVVVAAARPPLAELRALVTPRQWAPKRVLVVDEVPMLANGKPDRLALRRLAADA